MSKIYRDLRNVRLMLEGEGKTHSSKVVERMAAFACELENEVNELKSKVADLENTRPASGELVEVVNQLQRLFDHAQGSGNNRITISDYQLQTVLSALTQPGKVSVSRASTHRDKIAGKDYHWRQQ